MDHIVYYKNPRGSQGVSLVGYRAALKLFGTRESATIVLGHRLLYYYMARFKRLLSRSGGRTVLNKRDRTEGMNGEK